jgi:predicted nicotinamide N-methyase
MKTPLDLQQALGELLGDARLVACGLPQTDLKLWLIDGDNMDRAFSPEETRRILHEPPYWSFCWASGLTLTRWQLPPVGRTPNSMKYSSLTRQIFSPKTTALI